MPEEHFQEASDTLVIKALLVGQSDVSVGNDCCLSHYHHHSEKNQSISLSVKAHLGEQLLMMMMTHINTDGSAQSVHLLVSKSTNQGIS